MLQASAMALIRQWLCALLVVALASRAQADNCASQASGLWGSIGVRNIVWPSALPLPGSDVPFWLPFAQWSCGHAPAVGDDVFVSHDVNLSMRARFPLTLLSFFRSFCAGHFR